MIKNILNHVEEAPFTYKGNSIFGDFSDSIRTVERIGKYKDPDEKLLDILVIRLQKETSLDRARTKQRNFVAKYLKGNRGGALKDAALAAFVSPNGEDWRFSLVKMAYKFNEKGKIKEEFTPARRYSFLVGKNENSHTAQSRFLPLLRDDEANPTLQELEDAFSVERVTKEFFEKYRDLFLRLKESLDRVINKDSKVRIDFKNKRVSTVDFAKKLLGQIVFLYFLQKKGWFGIQRGKDWGSGSKRFLRELFEKKHGGYKNFFNDILEPLFYEALRLEHPGDYYSRFDCRIPFLNGGLFDPINDYDWWNTDILLPNEIFSNNRRTKEGDTGDGILDVFDLYNFTVKEDEPLEKEVAVDPEMLGKVFENLLEVKDRKSKGTYYTRREIVHYMCQESLVSYLVTELEGKVNKGDIEKLINYGESAVEHDSRVLSEGRETRTYAFKLPQSIRENVKIIDERLASIRVCDPAVGSGAFPVGMMNEIIRTRNALTPYIGEDGERSPYNFKHQAIQHCLYGVDIDPGAVEIAKLRLWLSLVVDEEEREGIQPLPNLDYKIVQGNSLLGVAKDLFNQPFFNQLEELKPRYFNETSARKKQKYKNQIDELIRQITKGHEDFDFEVYFSEVFHDRKGFDVVIANPPYIDSEAMVKKGQKDLRDLISRTYAMTKGNWDIYIAFFERGFKILNTNGALTFITPDKWIAKPFGSELRKSTIDNIYAVLKAGRKVFEEAKVDAVVSFFIKTGCRNLNVFSFEDNEIIFRHQIDKRILREPFAFDFVFSNYLPLLRKIEAGPGRLADSFECENACATSDAYKLKPFIKNSSADKFNQKKELKVINTGTIGKYAPKWGKSKMTYLKDRYLYPVVDRQRFLKEFNNSYSRKSVQSKIIIKGLTLLDACFDAKGVIIPGKSTLMIANTDVDQLKVVLAILNSRLPFFYIKEKYPSSSYNQGINFTKNMVNDLPLPRLSEDQRNAFVRIVDKIFAIIEDENYLENYREQAKVRDYEKQIDQLVYKHYSLTPEEIKVIENL